MSQQPPDPAGWLADLMKAQRTVLSSADEVFDTSEALAAAARPWTKAVADFTAWQLIPNAHLAVMDNCGHWPRYEDTETFNKIHLDFPAGSLIPAGSGRETTDDTGTIRGRRRGVRR